MRLVPNLKPRFVAGHRIHHGLVGALLAAAGLILMVDDIHDRKAWLPDFLTKIP